LLDLLLYIEKNFETRLQEVGRPIVARDLIHTSPPIPKEDLQIRNPHEGGGSITP